VGQYKDLTGKFVQKPLKGARTKADADVLLAAMELNVTEGRAGIARPQPSPLVGPLMSKWLDSLSGRARKGNRQSVELHLRPRFGEMTIAELNTVKTITNFIRDIARQPRLDGAGIISPEYQRTLYRLLSRFFTWLGGEELVTFNAFRMVRPADVPKGGRKRPHSWIEDDTIAQTVYFTLKAADHAQLPWHLLFLLGNRCGLRNGEIAGLRLSDFALAASRQVLRVRYNRNGPLKEHKGHDLREPKYTPIDEDTMATLRPWLDERRAAGAGPEDYVFPSWGGKPISRSAFSHRWVQVRDTLPELIPPHMCWYDATRHTRISSLINDDVAMDQVMKSANHKSVATTENYNHVKIPKFSDPGLRKGLALATASPAPVPKLLPQRYAVARRLKAAAAAAGAAPSLPAPQPDSQPATAARRRA